MAEQISIPKINVRARHKYCYLKRLAPTHEKLTLPTQVNIGENVQEAIIIKVGEDVTDLNEGDHVHYMKPAATTFSVRGHEVVLVNADAIVGVIHGVITKSE